MTFVIAILIPNSHCFWPIVKMQLWSFTTPHSIFFSSNYRSHKSDVSVFSSIAVDDFPGCSMAAQLVQTHAGFINNNECRFCFPEVLKFFVRHLTACLIIHRNMFCHPDVISSIMVKIEMAKYVRLKKLLPFEGANSIETNL